MYDSFDNDFFETHPLPQIQSTKSINIFLFVIISDTPTTSVSHNLVSTVHQITEHAI